MSNLSQHSRRKAHVIVLQPQPIEFDKRPTYEFVGRDAKGEFIWWVRP